MSVLILSSAFLLCAQDELPEDKDKETFVNMCSNCHAIERVVKVRFSRKFWASVVDDMVSRGAEGTEEEVESVIGYLSRHFAKIVNINTATVKELSEGLSFKPDEAEALVKHRTDNGPFKDFEALTKVPGLNQKLLTSQKNSIKF